MQNEEITITHPDFGVVNYAILAIYLAAMVAIGLWTSRRVKGTRGFFVAEGRMHFVLVGLSLLATYLSALTMMGMPGASFGKDDWLWSVQLPFLIVTAIVITRFVLPRYREAGVTSVYEYLEQRIHVSARLLASLAFIAFSIGRMALVLYLPALAFHQITGVDLVLLITIMGVVVIIYSFLGGIQAVIITDAVMAIIFTIGAILSLAFVFWNVGGADFMAIASEHHKFRAVDWSLDWTKKATLWFILGTIFETIRIYGTQQDMTQRYMTTDSTAKANRSVWLAVLGFIPLGFVFIFIGTSLFVFYKANPKEDARVNTLIRWVTEPDWAPLAKRVSEDGELDKPNPGKKLWSQLDKKAQSTLKKLAKNDSAPPAALRPDERSAVENGIEKALKDPNFYDELSFADVKLDKFDKEIKGLLKKETKDLTRDQIQARNQLLLENAYPNEVAASQVISMPRKWIHLKDAIYPRFVVHQLPWGISGLIIAALFAASMSSVSSSLNSSSTVSIEDFYRRLFVRESSDEHYLLVARIFTVVWGVLAIIFAFLMAQVGKQVQDLWNIVMAASTCGVLGLMGLAFLPFRINRWAAIVGYVSSIICLLIMKYALGVNFLLYVVVNNLVCFFVALFLNPLYSVSDRIEVIEQRLEEIAGRD